MKHTLLCLAVWVGLGLVALMPTSAAQASEIAMESFTLDNGLKVIVIPNPRIPAVSHMLWFPHGGADDPYGQSGLTHFHEHLMFKGTPNHPAGEFEALVARVGGDHNAFTTYDATGYYVNIPKSALAGIMELEADRLNRITPTDDDVAKERDVIIEERRARIENHPTALFQEQLRAMLFVHHPYGTPLIGWMSEMEQLSKDGILKLHDRVYHTGNATLVLAGDITKDEARPMVERYYGGLQRREVIPRNWVKEPPMRGAKRFDMRHENVREPSWVRHYIAPSINVGKREDGMPLMLFTEWLGGGQTSYLYQELVVKQKFATAVSASYNPLSMGPELFSIYATPKSGVAMDTLEAAIDKALAHALTITPEASDIARAKTLLKAEITYAREGLQGIAYIVGWFEMLGLEADYINQWSGQIDAVTPAQMKAAAMPVLQGHQHITGTLLPAEGK